MPSNAAPRKFRRIATEEAFSIPEVADALREVSRAPGHSLDLMLVKTIYDAQAGEPRAYLRSMLLDLEQQRLRDMDDNGVDVHLLSLTAPGVQMFDADTATELATLANDRLAETISRHPTRFAGLASGQESHLALDFSVKALGVENVLWAIDYPYQPSAPAVQFMDTAPLSDADKAKVYHQNAERVFHIEPATARR